MGDRLSSTQLLARTRLPRGLAAFALVPWIVLLLKGATSALRHADAVVRTFRRAGLHLSYDQVVAIGAGYLAVALAVLATSVILAAPARVRGVSPAVLGWWAVAAALLLVGGAVLLAATTFGSALPASA